MTLIDRKHKRIEFDPRVWDEDEALKTHEADQQRGAHAFSVAVLWSIAMIVGIAIGFCSGASVN